MTLSLASGKEILSNNYANACGVAFAAQQGVSWLHVIDLTDADYDALLAVMQAEMRIWREIFPKN
jgi:hypothetical protein